jgi:WD40 repeat protein
MRIVSGSYDQTIRVWDAYSTGDAVAENDISINAPLLSHLHSDIPSMAFSHLRKMDGSLSTICSFFGYHPTFVTSCHILVTHLLLVLKARLSLIIAVFALVMYGLIVISHN